MNNTVLKHPDTRQDQTQKQITILYIEDNMANQLLVERILSRYNYRLLLADDGLTGLRMPVAFG